MAFVTNNHVLTQFTKIPEKDKEGRIIKGQVDNMFKKNKTVVFCTSGVIKP